ncbi:Peptidoglycan-N-acetylmuramic acid deacetylase PdaA precursor [compost metagenome]
MKRGKNGEQPDVGALNKKLLKEVNGIYVGNKNDKSIYLTFDMGYEAGYTEKILDILKEENVKAAFFITGHYLNSASDLVKRMIDEGHIVGNHTVNHKSMPDISDEANKDELNKLNQMIYEKFGYEMYYMRPPEGEYSQRTLAIAQTLGYKTVLWSFAYLDFDDKNPPKNNDAIEKIMVNLHNGEIMLLHGTSKVNMEILKEVIEKIKSNGFEFKSLDEFKE